MDGLRTRTLRNTDDGDEYDRLRQYEKLENLFDKTSNEKDDADADAEAEGSDEEE